MRKYIVGTLFGFVLAFSLSAHADDIKSLMGKAVQGTFPVTVEGKLLDKQSIVIDGTSYLPIKSISDAVGYDAKFNASSGITLNKKTTVTESTYDAIIVTQEINRQKRIIWAVEGAITTSPSSSSDTDIERFTIYEQWKVTLKRAKDELAIWEARKAALTP
jgi:hypothetical protein